MCAQYSPSQIQKTIETRMGKLTIFSLPKLEKLGWGNVHKLPFSIKILLENALRNYDGYQVTETDIQRIVSWSPNLKKSQEIAFKPGRVILQDFTGVPCVVDLAAMRSAMKRMGGDYRKIDPKVRCDLIIDHSAQVDFYGAKSALTKNLNIEFARNKERYEFLKWGQKAFENFNVIPPGSGIIHQINLEYLARGVLTKKVQDVTIAYPDSLIGADSHTTMINGLGIVGWGVGGIEAEAVMLGEPIYMLLPEVIGLKLTGRLKEATTASDLVLAITQLLRKKGVVGKFVEFLGDGIKTLSLPDRATISNMAPEYGATLGIFPVDEETLHYYRATGREAKTVDVIERYMKSQEIFYSGEKWDAEYTDIIELNLESVDINLAGPKRPHDRISLYNMKDSFKKALRTPVNQRGFGLTEEALDKSVTLRGNAKKQITHGTIAIASITSCTNTSNPSILIGAGLLAKKAISKGLNVKGHVKTSFAPGSKVVKEYLQKARLLPFLEKLGFHIVGYGCMTCIGNSGPLPKAVSEAIKKGDLIAVSISSGNRNFEGRISPSTKANYLASPLLVIAYALAGTVNIDLLREPIGKGKNGKDVFLKDIWPSQKEINHLVHKVLTAQMYRKNYKNIVGLNAKWKKIETIKSDLYEWKEESTYIKEPPFFKNLSREPNPISEIKGARVLVMLGDTITTDHISPAGPIALDSPAGRYLIDKHVRYTRFNSYGSRRGNDRVMTRGTFANVRLRNLLTPGKEGSWTVCFLDNKEMSIYDASEAYKQKSVPLIVLAGKEYGTGSSRDWAAKGTALLGVKVVLAESFERIHRSNLIGMGVLPLQFHKGESKESLGLKGNEVFDFIGLSDKIKPHSDIGVIAKSKSGPVKKFSAKLRLDTQIEIDYYKNGGILQTVLRKLLKN